MDTALLKGLLIFCGVACIIWWMLKEMEAPRPIWIIAILVLGFVAIDFLITSLGGQPLVSHRL